MSLLHSPSLISALVVRPRIVEGKPQAVGRKAPGDRIELRVGHSPTDRDAPLGLLYHAAGLTAFQEQGPFSISGKASTVDWRLEGLK